MTNSFLIPPRYDGLPGENSASYKHIHQFDGAQASFFSLIREELYSILMSIIVKHTKERVSPKQNAKKETKKIPTAKYMAIRLRYTFQILLKLIFALPNIKINVKYIWPSNWTILIPKQSQTWK